MIRARTGRGIARRLGVATGVLGAMLAAYVSTAPAYAQSSTLASSVAASPATPEYRISVGDQLDVSVWGDERMQRTVLVLPDGSFAFPLAGTISAAGRTVDEVSDAIRERIAGYYRAEIPDVTVGVREAAALTFYVVGKVRTPGTFATVRAVNIVQALSMAGGLAEFADVRNAVILRQTPAGQVVEPVKLAAILKGRRRLGAGALAQSLPVLASGDVLVIP